LAIRRWRASDLLLGAATGFQAKPAETPEKLANLKSVSPRKLVSQIAPSLGTWHGGRA
jgi:hypothetical protein